MSGKILWRLQGPKRVVAAALYQHPIAEMRELRVYFEPEDAGDVLFTQAAHAQTGVLEAKAEEMLQTLREKGWWPIKDRA